MAQSKMFGRTAARAIAGALGMIGLAALVGIPSASASAAPAHKPSASPAGTSCAGASPPVAAPSGQWSCTFDDEFNGTSLDTTKWHPMLTSNSNYVTGPWGSWACYENTPQTISESGGYLNLSVVATPQAFPCYGISGASVTTNYMAGMVYSQGLFDQEYGYFEVRAAMPEQTTPGLQETLWLFPQDETKYGAAWPDSGEIDFGEFYSEYPNNDIPIDHYPGSTSDPNATNDYCTRSGVTTAGQFNTYAVLWTPTTITTYFDGVPCFTDNYWHYVTYPDTAPAPFNQPFFLNLTQALGVGSNAFSSSTKLPATTKVDWVRAWQY